MAASASALSGGAADKLGNRYEGWWTIWRGVVPVLRDQYESITVEKVGEAGEAAEFRLSGRLSARSDQVHQCKRSHSTRWTINALRREGLLEPFGRHLSQGVEVVFASGAPCELTDLSDKARRLTVGDWMSTLTARERPRVEELADAWEVDEPGVHNLLERLFIEVITDLPLRNATLDSLRTQIDGDPEIAQLILGDLLTDRMSAPLTANDLWAPLRRKGYIPGEGGSQAAHGTVGRLTKRYVDGVSQRRPRRLALVDRPEVDQILAVLTSKDTSQGVVVTGPPGGGKSTVLAEVCARLTALGVVVGPLRLDVADVAFDARGLGQQDAIGFGASPVAVVERAAAGRLSVLVIDQLDALSLLANSAEPVLDGVREVMEAARTSQTMRLLVACRRHDLKHDRHLRELLSGLTRMELGPLSSEQVDAAVTGLGIAPQTMSLTQRRLLGSPLALRLLADVVPNFASGIGPGSSWPRAGNLTELLAAFDFEMRRRLRGHLGVDNFTRGVEEFARQLSDSGLLSASRESIPEPGPDVLDALIREGVLVEDAGRVRFFHEEYFDYTFAGQHIRRGGTAANLLGEGGQDLFRRRQVRSVLSLERNLDAALYQDDLRRILARSPVRRSHIRSACLIWLMTLDSASTIEYELVADIATDPDDPLSAQAFRTLVSSGFVPHLLHRGLVAGLGRLFGPGGDQKQERIGPHEFTVLQVKWMLTEAARVSPEEVSEGLLEAASNPEAAVSAVGVLLWAVFLAGQDAGPATVALFATTATTIAETFVAVLSGDAHGEHLSPEAAAGAAARLFGTDGLHALSTLANRTSAPAAYALGAWLRARNRVARARGAEGAFSFQSGLPREGTGLAIFQRAAERDPLRFLAELNAALLAEFDRMSFEVFWRPTGDATAISLGLRWDGVVGIRTGVPDLREEVVDGWRTALILAAEEHPLAAAQYLGQLTATDQRLAHELAAAAFARSAPELHEAAFSWARRPDVRGLPAEGTIGWAWAEVLAHLALTDTPDGPDKVISMALTAYGSVDLEELAKSLDLQDEQRVATQDMAQEELVVLSVIERRLGSLFPEVARHRLVQLENMFGPAPATSSEWRHHDPFGPGDEESAAAALTDDEWVAAIDAFSLINSSEEVGFHGRTSLPDRLEVAARMEPGRMAQLIVRCDAPRQDPRCALAIIRGVKEGISKLNRPGAEFVTNMVLTMSRWALVELNRPMSWLVGELKAFDLPAGVLTWLAGVATDASDPDLQVQASTIQDLAVAGMNCDRGAAAHAIAQILGPHEHRVERLRYLLPAIIKLATDEFGQVRGWVPMILLQIPTSEQAIVTDLTRRWLSVADSTQYGAPFLERLTWRMLRTEPEVGLELLRCMLASNDSAILQRGGIAVANALIYRMSAGGNEVGGPIEALFDASLLNASARQGVASALAANVADLPREWSNGDRVGADERLLIGLLDDEDGEVRQAALGFAYHLTGPPETYKSILSAVAMTKAFNEDPRAVFYALHDAGSGAPLSESLALCESWLSVERSTGDMRSADSATGYHVSDIVLSLHSRTAPASPERARVLDLLDRLVDAGAVDIDQKTDEWAAQ